jgi:PAS domain S-box-containing protein
MAVALRNLQYAVNQCQDVIFFTDPAGMIERVNPAFEELTGYSSVEAVGQDLSWIAAEGPKSDSYRRIWEQVFQGRAFRGNLQVRRKHGAPLSWMCSSRRCGTAKGELPVCCAPAEIPAKSANWKTQLSQARRMDAIGTLAGGVAHDFNNNAGGKSRFVPPRSESPVCLGVCGECGPAKGGSQPRP